MKQRGWFWLLFLILIIGLLAVLATRFNILLVVSNRKALLEPVLGTLGFIVILAGVIALFARLTQEMRLNQLQSEFLAAVTHELKTPIATLELSSSLLRLPETTEVEREQLWKSHETELHRLRNEVEALLEAARWDAKAVRSKRTEVNLDDWIQSKWEDWRRNLGAGATLSRRGDALPIAVKVDPKMLEMICNNLIENSKKFARAKPKVTVETERLGNRWKIHFRDDGHGFEPNESKKIFRRFYRAKHSAPYSIAGTGLGLYLAKSACRRMKISISAGSAGPEHGAVFTLSGKSTGTPT
ncbi:MAG: HAMP domain-containing histidine kinase [Cryobacterium sp.]|nr:HAMP domain-containing histidine kinase [Oligoflexia bacterium]